jgi:hypothetical protein
VEAVAGDVDANALSINTSEEAAASSGTKGRIYSIYVKSLQNHWEKTFGRSFYLATKTT